MKNKIAALLLMLSASLVSMAQAVVSGTVYDADGYPFPGASVVVAGTTQGTITDIDGNFQLSVSDADTKSLNISCIGYKNSVVALASQKTGIKVTLEEETTSLDEVVAIGYGTVTKKDLTGSVASVKGETLAKIPVANVAQALNGRMAGVQITSTDGAPDAEMVVRVRGGGSITGDSSPLYIVDGFPVSSISDIAAGDIESIDVLKDASSTAIYGSQGSNGVVIITTKSAKAGKTTVSYQGFMQIKSLSRHIKAMDTYDYVMSKYEYALLSSGESSFQENFGSYDDLYLYKSVKATDWEADLFGADVISHQHNLNLQGGSDKTTFSLSGTYNYDGGLMPNNDYSRLICNFKLQHKISDRLKFICNARVSNTTTNGSGTSGGTYKIRSSQAVTGQATTGLSGMIKYDTSKMSDDELEEYRLSQMTLAEQAARYYKLKLNRLANYTAALEWEIIKGLSARVEGGYQQEFSEARNFWDYTTTQATYVGGLGSLEWTKTTGRKVRESATLTYKFDIQKDHKFNFMIGQELVNTMSEKNYMYAAGFSKDLGAEKCFANVSLGENNVSISATESPDDRLASFFGRFNYSYKDRYLLTATMRADGSSKFADGHRWGYFPSAALAWRVIEESIMETVRHIFSNLKLRVSYGASGNNKISSTQYMLTYKTQSNSKNYGVGDTANTYYQTTNSQLANPDLTWETTITRNLGLDFSVLNDRLQVEMELYKNSANDLLIERTISAPGYTSTYENTGETSNRGIEINVNGYMIQRQDFTLSANFNIGFNKSRVEKLANGLTEMSFNSGWASTDNKGQDDYRIYVGQPVGLMYGWVVDEKNPYYTTDDFVSNSGTTYIMKDGIASTDLVGGKVTGRPGCIRFKDLDGDGDIDTDDRQVIGDANPKFTGGFGLNGTFRGFDASVLFNFVVGNDVYNADKIASSQMYRAGSFPNFRNEFRQDNCYTYLDRSTGELVTDLNKLAEMNEGKNAKEYWSPYSFGSSTVATNSWAIEKGSFLRFQNLTIGYTLPSKISRKFACDNFRVYGTLNNIFVLTKYTGYDPEVSTSVRNSSYSALTPGVDYSSYPKSFSYTIGLNMTF